jgi:hypothetical protein
VRRGVRHGFVDCVSKPPPTPAGLDRCFAAGEPILLRGWLAVSSARAKARIEATRLWFERLRRDESFSDGLRERLARRRGKLPALKFCGTSTDVGDPREIEKVHIELGGMGSAGKQLYAKLSWIAEDERDHSLRVRFSFGNERSGAWRSAPRSALAGDQLAELVFPECELLARHRALLALLDRLHGAPVRLSERIVYSNAPGGGASFHHDAEPGQLAVVYGQMCGSTGWLALPRGALAQELAALAAKGPLARRAGTPKKAAVALENTAFAPLDALLN